MATQSPTRVKPLDKQRILEAAIAYADEHGVGALTMRGIAENLECGVMSLYNHVANKEEMLVGMVDIVAGKIDLPLVDGDWKGALRASAANAHEVLLRHQWAPAQWSLRMPGPARIRYMDSILQVLTKAELKPKLVYSGYHAVTMHIIGFTLQEIGYQQVLDADFDELANKFIKDLAGDFPHMADHVRAHMDDNCDSDEFGFVLDLILDGLERVNVKP